VRILGRRKATIAQAPDEPPPTYLDARTELAARYLLGEGLEIGALHQPLRLPPHARARYVDRLPVEQLRRQYPELAGWELTKVDLIDDGERLATVADGSQDFIVANHFLEHCEDPIGAIANHLAKLRPGGVLLYAVPDKRYTFDFRRPTTPIEHMVADHEEGAAPSRGSHYDEWATLVDPQEGETRGRALERAREIEATGYSIHMHVWTQAEFLRLMITCRERFDEAFDIEAAARQGLEFVVVLRKRGAFPRPAAISGEARIRELARLWAKSRLRARVWLRRRLGR
jgi:SAM-dependent methyltransferase